MERQGFLTHNEHAVQYRDPVIVNPPVIGPVVTAPPIAGAPVVVGPVAQPWQFPLQHAGYPSYYEVPVTMPYPVRGGEDGEFEYEYRFFPGPFYGPYPRPFYGPYPRPFFGPGPFYGPGPIVPLPPFFI